MWLDGFQSFGSVTAIRGRYRDVGQVLYGAPKITPGRKSTAITRVVMYCSRGTSPNRWCSVSLSLTRDLARNFARFVRET